MSTLKGQVPKSVGLEVVHGPVTGLWKATRAHLSGWPSGLNPSPIGKDTPLEYQNVLCALP